MEMKKKVVEQSKLVKLKESSDQKVGKLVHEIQVSSDFLQCCPMKGRVCCVRVRVITITFPSTLKMLFLSQLCRALL